MLADGIEHIQFSRDDESLFLDVRLAWLHNETDHRMRVRPPLIVYNFLSTSEKKPVNKRRSPGAELYASPSVPVIPQLVVRKCNNQHHTLVR